MMTNKYINLKNRSVISISGVDRKTFLQGLITGDINKVGQDSAIYSLMLGPQGRFLYDFFIINHEEKLLLDCNAGKMGEIIQKLSLYKLRAQVEIKEEKEFLLWSFLGKEKPIVSNSIIFSDPRDSKMGWRLIASKSKILEEMQSDDLDLYNICRLNLKIADDSDLVFDKSFPLEFGFDNLNAIDYQKGCYVGQENTARMHYRGKIRKKIFLVEIPHSVDLKINNEIISQNKKIGEILSCILCKEKLLALALIKNLDIEDKEVNLEILELKVDDKIIKIIK